MAAQVAASLSNVDNPVGLDGFGFIEFTGPEAKLFESLFAKMGFVQVAKHKTQNATLWQQNDICFLITSEPGSFASNFQKQHGPSICSTGFRVRDAKAAWQEAVKRGAKPYDGSGKTISQWPAVYGIGDSLIYFVDQYGDKGN